MKYMRPPLVAIFFMTNFYRDGRFHGSLAPPGSATGAGVEITYWSFYLKRKKSVLLFFPFLISS